MAKLRRRERSSNQFKPKFRTQRFIQSSRNLGAQKKPRENSENSENPVFVSRWLCYDWWRDWRNETIHSGSIKAPSTSKYWKTMQRLTNWSGLKCLGTRPWVYGMLTHRNVKKHESHESSLCQFCPNTIFQAIWWIWTVEINPELKTKTKLSFFEKYLFTLVLLQL